MRRRPPTKRRFAAAAAAFVAVTLLSAISVPGAAAQPGLTHAEALANVYRHILDASFERAAKELEAACGPAPPVACDVFDATAMWWRIHLDPRNQALDAAFMEKVEASIAAAEEWTRREPGRAEAWFYAGGAYGLRVNLRVLRGERLAAARDGRRIMDSLERAVAIDPSMHDARFGTGLYRYYAAIAPRVARFLRWLLLLPGGNRELGLRELQTAGERGVLVRGEADYQLHLIYLWYEERFTEALELLHGLRDAHPRNPLFLERIAAVEHVYLNDPGASLASYRQLLEAARSGRVNAPAQAEAWARLGIARHLEARHETDRAIEHLEAVVALKPEAPYGVLSIAHLRLAAAHDRLGDRERTQVEYNLASSAAPPDDPHRVRSLVRERAARPTGEREAEAYRLSIEGWRLIERGRLDEAEAALDRSVELQPRDPVTRFRRGMLYRAQQLDARAIEEFQETIAARPKAPPSILASAYLEAGRLHDRAGDHARAIEMYASAARVHGADRAIVDTASRLIDSRR
jgi:tetratricopeptide (TPR) repeat protein